MSALPPDRRPMNLLILMGDQHRWDALSCAHDGLPPEQRTWLMDGPGGRPLVRTPHLDRLAATGTRFTQAVANLPVCVPCRHSFISGLYPHQIGILTNAHYWPYDPPVPILSTYLRDAGYATASVGKMHWKNRNAPDDHVPDKRGFDFRAGRGGNTDGPVDVSLTGGVQSIEERRRADQISRFGVGGESREGYVGDVAPQTGDELPEAWLAGQAVQWLERHAQRGNGQPFCLMLSLDRPHPPNVIPADYEGMYSPDDVPLPPVVPAGFVEDDATMRRQIEARGWRALDETELRTSIARYLTNVTYVDDCLGRALEALDRLGFAENTLVVLLSDHGELLGERRQPGFGGGHTKYCLYDSAMRVPLIVRWPGIGQPGQVSHAAVELIDLLPTWLDAAGVAIPAMLPGSSLRPLVEGQNPESIGWREHTLSEQYTSAETPQSPRGQWAIRTARYKLIERAGGRSALFDLVEDPNEFRNRIDDPEMIDVRDFLRGRLLRDVIRRAEQYPAQHEGQVTIARAAASR